MASSKQFMVKEISSDGEAILVPFDKNGCAGCGGTCSGCHVTVTAKNKKNLPIKVGYLVSLNFSTRIQKVFNISTLLIPILCAILCFAFSPSLARLFGTQLSEGFKSAVTLGGFALPALILFIVARFAKGLTELQITEIL